jgi:pimeloyl-ACP methyl ester carboxylesterase
VDGSGDGFEALHLDDGRVLELTVSGPAGAPVLLFLHGTPGCAYQPGHLAGAVHERGMRLVIFSRPGYAGSSRLANRSVADVVGDCRAVLDALGVDRALVAGVSGGGPHALASATLLPDRFAAALVIVGVAPADADGLEFLAGMGAANVEEFGAAFHGEAVLRPYLEEQAAELRAGGVADLIRAWESMLPDVDQRVLNGDLGQEFMNGVHHALSGTVDGWLDDDLAFVRPWGFDLADLHIPTTMWHGGLDLMVPFSHGRWLAEHLPGVEAHLERNEGHLSVRVGRFGAMLDDLLALAGR